LPILRYWRPKDWLKEESGGLEGSDETGIGLARLRTHGPRSCREREPGFSKPVWYGVFERYATGEKGSPEWVFKTPGEGLPTRLKISREKLP